MSSDQLSLLRHANLTAIANLPAGEPPPGVKPNFKNPQRDTLAPLVTLGLLEGLMLIFCAFQAYSKIVLSRKLWWDDACLLLGAIGAIMAYIGAAWSMTSGSMGYHEYDLTVGTLLSSQANFVSSYIFCWGGSLDKWFFITFVKLSFLLMYYSLFGTLRWMKIAIWISAPVITAFHFGYNFAVLWIQTPRPGESFLEHVESGAELPLQGLVAPGALAGTIIDFYILILPIPAIWGLQMPRGRKIGLGLVFGAGLFACIASAVNYYFRLQFQAAVADEIHDILRVYWVSVIEFTIGVCCACTPAVPRVLRSRGTFARLRSLLQFSTRKFNTDGSDTLRDTLDMSKSRPSGHPSDRLPRSLMATSIYPEKTVLDYPHSTPVTVTSQLRSVTDTADYLVTPLGSVASMTPNYRGGSAV